MGFPTFCDDVISSTFPFSPEAACHQSKLIPYAIIQGKLKILTQSYLFAHLLLTVRNLTCRTVSYQHHGYCKCLETNRLLACTKNAREINTWWDTGGTNNTNNWRKRDHGINKELKGSTIIIVRIVKHTYVLYFLFGNAYYLLYFLFGHAYYLLSTVYM